MNGFLNINKPVGLTSHDVVARVRRLAGRGVKVGHAGTLDPAATGVLPVALGQATRLIEYLAEARKGYRALVHLGITTTTDDAEGEVLARRPLPPLDAAAVEQALASFRGAIMQVPPMYSALHHEGRRLYELARAGTTVERAARPVTIYHLQILDLRLQIVNDDDQSAISDLKSAIVLDVECSKGTYIRALARDLGEALGCGAHLAALERTAVGPFHLEQAVPLAELAAGHLSQLLPPETAILDWPRVDLSSEQVRRVCHGLSVRLEASATGQLRAHGPDAALVALLQQAGDEWRPGKVFA